MQSLILTVIGPDRPGLVRALAGTVAAHGGNWLESRMARLAGQFTGIVRIEAPATIVPALRALESEGLSITVMPVTAAPAAVGLRLTIEVVGHDRPGIVRDVAQVLAAHGGNIEELTTDAASGSFSGETMFRATAQISVPDEAAEAAIRAGLEHLSNEMMVDIRPAAEA